MNTTDNRILSDGTWTYGYNAAGNLTSKVHNTTTETWTYTYNGDNLLTKAEHKAMSGGPIDLRVEFVYDLFGNRIRKSVDSDGDGPGIAVVTKFAYENGNAWADVDASTGSLITRRLYGFGLDTLLARIGTSGQEDWYLLDKLGSVRDIVNSGGTVIDHLAYDPFGKVTTETQPANGDRYKFTAREWDAEIALYYYRARYIDPAIMKFLSQDPMGFGAGDPNLYRYVGNNPTNGTDPTGLTALPSLERGRWIQGTAGNGVFEYNDTSLNRQRGVVGLRVRWENQHIPAGGFPVRVHCSSHVLSRRRVARSAVA